jgi:hypothetical protein
MKRALALVLLLALLAACRGTPVATEPPPTQTPWIVVVTSTSVAQEAGEAPPATAAPPTATAQATATSVPATATMRPTQETAGSAQQTPVATASPVPQAGIVATGPSPTGARLYEAPTLLEPAEDQTVAWSGAALFKWSQVGSLRADEYYHLHLERRPRTAGQPWYGDYVFTKETQFLAEASFLAPFHPSVEHGQATLYWWVRVVHKTGEDENGKPLGIDISPYSEERTLILDPKP